jgi:hypothetical protein
MRYTQMGDLLSLGGQHDNRQLGNVSRFRFWLWISHFIVSRYNIYTYIHTITST